MGEGRRIHKDIDEERLINKVNDENRYGWREREREGARRREREKVKGLRKCKKD